jgi:hypothetical protein
MAPPSNRRPSPAQNLKSVISAAALAATLSGWAILANTEPPEPLVASAAPAQSERLQPIPTLVPLVEVRPRSVQSQPTPQLQQSAPIISTRSSR